MGYAWGSWYVSVVSTFPNTLALVLDSNLYDLKGTNPDWRCFQQNCHGVIYVQKQKFSEWPETPRNLLLENIKNTGRRIHIRGVSTCPQGWGARPLPRGPPVGSPVAIFCYMKSFVEEKIISNLSGRDSAATRRNLGGTNLGLLSSGRGKSSPSSSPTLLSSGEGNLHQHLHQHHRLSKP